MVATQGLKRTIKNTPNIDAFAEIHFQMKISDLSASTKLKKLAFLYFQSSNLTLQPSIFKLLSLNSFFKLHSSNSIFKLHYSNSTLPIQSSKIHSSNLIFKTELFKFYLQLQYLLFFRQIVQFQVIKNLLKNSKIK